MTDARSYPLKTVCGACLLHLQLLLTGLDAQTVAALLRRQDHRLAGVAEAMQSYGLQRPPS